MRYSTEPKFRKYVKGNSFLSIARKCGDKYGKKLVDTAKKQKKQNRNRCCKNFKKSSSENCRSYRRFDRK